MQPCNFSSCTFLPQHSRNATTDRDRTPLIWRAPLIPPSVPASLSILGCLPPPNGREVERNGKYFFTQLICEKTDTPHGRHSASPIVLPYACARRDDACAHESRKLTWSFGNGERSFGTWEERAAKSDRFGTPKRTLSVSQRVAQLVTPITHIKHTIRLLSGCSQSRI